MFSPHTVYILSAVLPAPRRKLSRGQVTHHVFSPVVLCTSNKGEKRNCIVKALS